LALVPVGIALGFGVRRWLLLSLGGLPGVIFLGAINQAAYGRILATGYGNQSWLFASANAPGTLIHYAIWLPVLLTPLVVLALGLPLLRRRQPLPTTLLAVWALVFLVFYLVYSHTHDDWWYLRFLLPAFPPLVVAAMAVGRALAGKLGVAARRWWLVPLAAGIVVHGAAWSRYLHAYSIGRGEEVYADTAAWVSTHLPARAVVASMQTSGALLYYTGFTFIRWDMITPAEFQRIAAACATADRPIYAVLHPFEIEDQEWDVFGKHLPGRWTQVGAVRHVTVWRHDSSPAPP
jgi:hypothetical protein